MVVHGKPSFFLGRGTLSLRVDTIRAVGIGELLARIERLRAAARRRGALRRRHASRPSAVPARLRRADHRPRLGRRADVVANATARWPAVRFRLEHPATQGALRPCRRSIEAIGVLRPRPRRRRHRARPRWRQRRGPAAVLGRDALPRRIAACRTPVISAIGHEPDHPIVDDVADRAVLDADRGRVAGRRTCARSARSPRLRDRARRALAGWVDREERLLDALRHRPVLADPLPRLERAARRGRAASATPPGRASSAAWTGAPRTSRTRRAPDDPGSGRDAARGATPSCSGYRRTTAG